VTAVTSFLIHSKHRTEAERDGEGAEAGRDRDRDRDQKTSSYVVLKRALGRMLFRNLYKKVFKTDHLLASARNSTRDTAENRDRITNV
jgi:hypothetical protein